MAAISSKEAQAHLIDPMNAPEPAEDTGLNSHFGSTFAPKAPIDVPTAPGGPLSGSPALASRNPFRDSSSSPTTSPSAVKGGVSSHTRHISNGGSRERFPAYQDESSPNQTHRRSGSGAHRPPPAYEEAVTAGSSTGQTHRRRTSSLKERYPGDSSVNPLDIIRRDSRKADRSPHLRKKHMPGADSIDRLDPAVGGRAYHHEGPFDAALMARNLSAKSSPIAALKESNNEALKATPPENIKDALERHQPLDGVAQIPPGVPDRLGRTYNYQEGDDLLREPGSDAGYKRWPGKDYDPEDLKGQSEPTFSLDRALQAHRISDNDGGMELQDRAGLMKDYHERERRGTLDTRDPVAIAGDDGKYADAEIAAYGQSKDNDAAVRRTGSLRAAGDSLKKRIGSLRKKRSDD